MPINLGLKWGFYTSCLQVLLHTACKPVVSLNRVNHVSAFLEIRDKFDGGEEGGGGNSVWEKWIRTYIELKINLPLLKYKTYWFNIFKLNSSTRG